MSCINTTLEAIPRSTTHTTRRNTIPGWNSATDIIHLPHHINNYSAIRSLSVNKADSYLYSDNFKHATDLLIQYINLIINCMISHGIVPDSFLKANVVLIPKNKRLYLIDPNNYRAIAMSSIFSKILDKIIINKQSTLLKTRSINSASRSIHLPLCVLLLLQKP